MKQDNYLPVLYTIPKWKLIVKLGRKNVKYLVPELNKYIDQCILSKVLCSIGKSTKSWYDRWVLNATVPSDLPRCKCPDCNRFAIFQGVSVGYSHLYCDIPGHNVIARKLSHLGKKASEDTKRKISEGTKLAYKKNPNIVLDRTKTLKGTLSTKESKEKKHNIMIDRYSTEESRKSHSDRMKLLYQERPEIKNKISESLIKTNKSDEVKKRRSESQLKSYSDNPNRSKDVSERNKINWTNGDYKNRVIESVKKSKSTEESKLRRSKSAIDRWKSPTEAMINNTKHPLGTDISIYSPWENRDIHLDSKWELDFFNICKELNISKVSRKVFSIKYLKSECNRYAAYIPDFIINDHYVVEIKPNYLLDSQTNIDKFNAADLYCRENGYEYIVITEDWLYPKDGCPRQEFYGKLEI